jgi:hypothetical protein
MFLRSKNFKIMLISILIALALGEGLLQFALPSENEYRMWLPHMQFTFEPDSSVIGGIHGASQFSINSEGLRSAEINPSAKLKILAIGGSTTIDMMLDQNETWTTLLQRNLQQTLGSAWIGNAGKNGLNSFHHIDQIKVLLQQFPQCNTVLIFMGVNDLQVTLVRGKHTAGDSLERYNKIFPVVPRQHFPLYQQSGYWRLAGMLKRKWIPNPPKEMVLDKEGKVLVKHRNLRAACKQKTDTLPQWTAAISSYTKNINTLIDIAAQKKVRLIFATQPVLWKSNNSKAQQQLMWSGGSGDFQKNGGQYYSTRILNESMQLFNRTLQESAAKRGIQVIDLYSQLPQDESIFYDDCHFTELGAKKTADIFAREISAGLKAAKHNK